MRIRTLKAVLVREWWINTRAYRLSFFAAIFMNSLFSLLIGYFLYWRIFAGQVTSQFTAYAGTDDYLSYLTVGVLVYTFAIRMLYPVRNFLEEERQGTLSAMILQGVPHLAYHLGCVLFSSLYSLAEVTALLAVASLFIDLNLAQVNAGSLLVSAVAAFWGLYGLSLTMSALILSVRDRVIVESFTFSLLNLISGVMFPVAYLPAPVQWLAQAVPLTPALRVLRAATLEGAPVVDLAPDLAVLAVLGGLYLLAGRWLLNRVILRVLEATA